MLDPHERPLSYRETVKKYWENSKGKETKTQINTSVKIKKY